MCPVKIHTIEQTTTVVGHFIHLKHTKGFRAHLIHCLEVDLRSNERWYEITWNSFETLRTYGELEIKKNTIYKNNENFIEKEWIEGNWLSVLKGKRGHFIHFVTPLHRWLYFYKYEGLYQLKQLILTSVKKDLCIEVI